MPSTVASPAVDLDFALKFGWLYASVRAPDGIKRTFQPGNDLGLRRHGFLHVNERLLRGSEEIHVCFSIFELIAARGRGVSQR
ncbi:MAG: hypothetical protein M3Y72_14680 [Acidobacteriota bacterium]|nr:hypothetical protein [Acidobacteriota bacterium]